jgi:molybdenum cofactor cytidylyltransferase
VPIAGIVLAAGRSRRMGSPKALLELEGRSFLERLVEALRSGGCEPVLVVVGEGPEHEVAARLADSLGAVVVVNRHADSEQIDSLRLALERLPPGAEGAMVTPVDVPLVDAVVVEGLITTFGAGDALLTLPRAGERHGHPVIFDRALFGELRSSSYPDGARGVVHAHLDRATFLDVDDRSLSDVDTLEDYRRLGDR